MYQCMIFFPWWSLSTVAIDTYPVIHINPHQTGADFPKLRCILIIYFLTIVCCYSNNRLFVKKQCLRYSVHLNLEIDHFLSGRGGRGVGNFTRRFCFLPTLRQEFVFSISYSAQFFFLFCIHLRDYRACSNPLPWGSCAQILLSALLICLYMSRILVFPPPSPS